MCGKKGFAPKLLGNDTPNSPVKSPKYDESKTLREPTYKIITCDKNDEIVVL